MRRSKLGLIANGLLLAMASCFLVQPASAQMTGDRCKDGVYGYCFRYWQRDGYQSLGECYESEVAATCPQPARHLRPTPARTADPASFA